MINDGMLKQTYKNYSKLLILILLTIVYISKSPGIFGWIDSYIGKYYVIPGIWSILIGVILLILPRIHPEIRIIKRLNIFFDAILCAIAFIIVSYVIGLLIYELRKTPYDQTARGILLNLLTVILPFIAIELIRGYVVGAYSKRYHITMFLFLVVLVTTVIDINWGNILTVQSLEKATILIAKDIAPDFCKNILLTYLAYYGGAMAAILYGGLLLIFHWFFPYLPQMNWLGESVIGILVPIMELFYIVNKYSKIYVKKWETRENWKDTLSWSLTLLFSVLLIWFVVGVFPIYPQVIMTGSMEPLIDPGDVVLVRKFATEDEILALKDGDIIVFQRDDIIITHRITDVILDKDGNLFFATKGDNNNVGDTRRVSTQELRGQYVTVIPKLGYPTLWLKSGNLDKITDVVN